MNRSQKGLLFMLFGFCWPWHNAQLHCSHKELWICKVLWPFQWNNDSHNIRLETDWCIKWSEPSIVWKISHSHIKTFAYETLWSNCVKKKKKRGLHLEKWKRVWIRGVWWIHAVQRWNMCMCVFCAFFPHPGCNVIAVLCVQIHCLPELCLAEETRVDKGTAVLKHVINTNRAARPQVHVRSPAWLSKGGRVVVAFLLLFYCLFCLRKLVMSKNKFK